ncbi:MAG TPA: radical SAM protein, partial [Planctomycetes bacterium]|nr:radical SAM protein [Planctomycetota bacterium]
MDKKALSDGDPGSNPGNATPATGPKTLDLLATTASELARAAATWFGTSKGAGLARAVHRDAVCKATFSPEDLGAGPRAAAVWRAHATMQLPTVVAEQNEDAGHGAIHKRLLQLRDGRTIESVSLPMGHDRRSLCVSTQVGCARGCTFCETGRLGLLRNLTAGEIVAQVTLQRQHTTVDQIVFQGMGEPLDNLDALLAAMRVLHDPNGIGLAQDRMTVCTVGHVPGIDALRELGWKRLGLSLSLNSADESRRAELMPHSVRYSLLEIQQALMRYRQRKNLALGVHWCLLPGINDTARDADQIAEFLAPLGRTFLHVIPFNPGHEPITALP